VCISVSYRKRHAVGDGRLCTRCRHLVNWAKHTCRLWFWPIPCISWRRDVIHKTGNTLPLGEVPAEATGNVQKICWNLAVWFLRYISGETETRTNRQTNTQTNRQTYGHADYNTSGGEVTYRKFGRVVFAIHKRTDRKTNKHKDKERDHRHHEY